MLIQFLVIRKQRCAGRYHVHGVQHGVYRAAGGVVIVVDWRGEGIKPFRIADVAEIEIQILGPVHVLGTNNVIVGVDNVGAVELIPHHTVIKAGRFLHQPCGELLFRHGTLQQKAKGLHLGRALGAVAVFAARARRRDAVIMRDHQVSAAFLGPRHQHFSRVGLDGIVGVHKLQILAPGLPQPQVAGRRHAAVGLVDQHNAVIDPGVHCAHLQADILAAVVQQQNFDIFIGLAADALHAAGNMILCVVNGYNDTDKRLFRHGGCPPFYNTLTIP